MIKPTVELWFWKVLEETAPSMRQNNLLPHNQISCKTLIWILFSSCGTFYGGCKFYCVYNVFLFPHLHSSRFEQA